MSGLDIFLLNSAKKKLQLQISSCFKPCNLFNVNFLGIISVLINLSTIISNNHPGGGSWWLTTQVNAQNHNYFLNSKGDNYKQCDEIHGTW